MKISFGTRISSDKIRHSNGYGYATKGMLESLERLGYHVSDNDATADVEIWFDQPQNWNFSKGPYKIGYHPWESTLLLPGWADIMNECDEIWTPSPLIAEWYRKYNGVNVPVHVYEHGIEHSWKPVRRNLDGPVKFLHVGADSARKSGWTTYRLLTREFAGRDDVTYTMKMNEGGWNGIPKLGKTHFISETYSFEQLQELFYEHDVYIYPSYGEGFGLTPLQAIASGMPTITVPRWAPYKKFLDPNLNIGSELKPTKWPKIHPGKMLRPSFDDVRNAMNYVVDNFDEAADFAYSQAEAVHEYYDWDRLTSKVFSDLEKRLESR